MHKVYKIWIKITHTGENICKNEDNKQKKFVIKVSEK